MTNKNMIIINEDYIETLELNEKKLSREDDGSVKVLEGYEFIGDRIFFKKEELDNIIEFLIKVRNLNNK